MENDGRPDNIVISRRRFLRAAAGLGLAGVAGHLLEACAPDSNPQAAQTPGSTPVGEANSPTSIAMPNDGEKQKTSTASTNPEGSIGSGNPSLTPTQNPEGSIGGGNPTKQPEAPTSVAQGPSPEPSAASTPAQTAEPSPEATPQKDNIPEFDDDQGRIVAKFTRHQLENGYLVELRYLVDPKRVSLSSADRLADSPVLDSMSEAMVGAVGDMIVAEQTLPEGYATPNTNIMSGLSRTFEVSTNTIDQLLTRDPIATPTPSESDTKYDWRKPDLSKLSKGKPGYTPPEDVNVRWGEEEEQSNGDIKVEMRILRNDKTQALIGQKGDLKEAGEVFNEVIANTSGVASKLARYLVDRGDLNPNDFGNGAPGTGIRRYYDDIGAQILRS